MNTQQQIEEKKKEIKDKKQEMLDFELDPDNYIEQYEDMLNEIHGEFLGMTASYILKKCDEIRYRCGLNDYVDSLDREDAEEYRQLESELEELETELEELESE